MTSVLERRAVGREEVLLIITRDVASCHPPPHDVLQRIWQTFKPGSEGGGKGERERKRKSGIRRRHLVRSAVLGGGEDSRTEKPQARGGEREREREMCLR
jgi:hypothetical protein